MKRCLSILLSLALLFAGASAAFADQLNELKVAPDKGIADTINYVNQLDKVPGMDPIQCWVIRIRMMKATACLCTSTVRWVLTASMALSTGVKAETTPLARNSMAPWACFAPAS